MASSPSVGASSKRPMLHHYFERLKEYGVSRDSFLDTVDPISEIEAFFDMTDPIEELRYMSFRANVRRFRHACDYYDYTPAELLDLRAAGKTFRDLMAEILSRGSATPGNGKYICKDAHWPERPPCHDTPCRDEAP